MGSYGVGVSRLVAAIAEQHHDDKGLVWPAAVAPADVHIVAAGKGDHIAAAVKLGEELAATGSGCDRGRSAGRLGRGTASPTPS